MKPNLTQKLIESHLQNGSIKVGENIALKVDQTLCQDATGTLVMLTLDAIKLNKVKTEISVQYIDHNLIQEDHKNPDDHAFLNYSAERFGLWFSRPGNGISHPLHMQYFARPGKSLIGSDSHTCANGCMGMLAIGTGGADVAMAIAGHPLHLVMPEIWGVELRNDLPKWVSAKDIILELLRRHGVEGGVGRIIEYHGEGLKNLSIWDRHVIANMGAELGATASVFPADDCVKAFMLSAGRGDEWLELKADPGCSYDHNEVINLAELEPLIAKPSSPGNVVTVASVEGESIQQAYIGSSANPGFRDYTIVAEIVKTGEIPTDISLDINPSSRDILKQLTVQGSLAQLIESGARIHQAGCNGCIGMGQAPATAVNSLRTTPRNFPGRSGTADDRVWLCSPETAAASALNGKITDPRRLTINYPNIQVPAPGKREDSLIRPPLNNTIPVLVERVEHGPNIAPLPSTTAIADSLQLPILLHLGNDVSTDEILPAGAEVLPFRSNIPKISEFVFKNLNHNYVESAKNNLQQGGHVIIAGQNYGQGSSREHAALAPAYLGLKVVIAASFARIHFQNLVNFGVLPLVFKRKTDKTKLGTNTKIGLDNIHNAIANSDEIALSIFDSEETIPLELRLSARQREILLAGGIIPWAKKQG
ncbi:aconitate hydratase [Alteromonadaceae bacterium BrNp21-10]|nr:aconitate hydratase [Alteromonadaceae bacterium BrNp21-10]